MMLLAAYRAATKKEPSIPEFDSPMIAYRHLVSVTRFLWGAGRSARRSSGSRPTKHRYDCGPSRTKVTLMVTL
jgi:hypothetical protein